MPGNGFTRYRARFRLARNGFARRATVSYSARNGFARRATVSYSARNGFARRATVSMSSGVPAFHLASAATDSSPYAGARWLAPYRLISRCPTAHRWRMLDISGPYAAGQKATDGDTMHVGTRSEIHTTEPARPTSGRARRWTRTLGQWVYSFTLVNMPDGETRWFVSRYDTPTTEHNKNGFPERDRMKFGAYWHPYREWTFTPAN